MKKLKHFFTRSHQLPGRAPRRLRTHTIGLLLAVAFFAAALLPPAVKTYRHAQHAQEAIQKTKTALEQQDFDESLEVARTARNELLGARASLSHLIPLQPIPIVGTQVRAAQVIIDVGVDLSTALRDGTLAAQQILGQLQREDGNVSLATLTPADKSKILERMSEAGPLFQSIYEQIAAAADRFRALPRRGLIGPLQRVVAPLREQLPFLQDAVAQLIPATQIIPSIAGFPEAKAYLFLLQNNSELRPTGGFIGTYGILKVSAGEITSFATSDVYTLDRPMRNTLFLEPPTPLKKYNATTQWFFRDSNWSPDFPTAAKKALEFYRLEQGPEKNLDGVIAVTPAFINSLLRVSGDITVDGITFTPENLVDRLQPLAERKELIGQMSKTLLQRILALPQDRWQELIVALASALNEKHMLLYARDEGLQQRILDQNWGGAIQDIDTDGVLVVDANLASLKTDVVMERSLRYELNVTHGEATATLKISYTNRGSFTKTTTRYRTYARVYVPLGSTLKNAVGAMQNDKLHGGRPGTVDVGEELERTVFGAFIAIEPSETKELVFTYTLPQRVSDAVTGNHYELYIQKQPGTKQHSLSVELKFPTTVKTFSGVDGSRRIDHTGVALETDLRRDRQLSVSF